jgi:hypothetical protein
LDLVVEYLFTNYHDGRITAISPSTNIDDGASGAGMMEV